MPAENVQQWEAPELVDLGSALEIVQGGGDCCLDGHQGWKGDKDAYTDGGDLLDDIA
jgi:hypothetical protein